MTQQNLTALVVAGTQAQRSLTRLALERTGFAEVTEAASVEEALLSLHAAVPSLAVIYVEMPEGDGFSLLRNIRREPTLQSLPVLMVTCSTYGTIPIRAKQYGARACIQTGTVNAGQLLQEQARLIVESAP